MKKLSNISKIVLNKFKSPVVWIGIASILNIIMVSSGYQIQDLTSWNVIGSLIMKVILNPSILISVSISIFAYLNNPSDRKHF